MKEKFLRGGRQKNIHLENTLFIFHAKNVSQKRLANKAKKRKRSKQYGSKIFFFWKNIRKKKKKRKEMFAEEKNIKEI